MTWIKVQGEGANPPTGYKCGAGCAQVKWQDTEPATPCEVCAPDAPKKVTVPRKSARAEAPKGEDADD